ncbi:hypothetical protein C8F01DRAFT_750670 [Mycena amicta]|nr:hypothetical protein C8F01DRAFT_750670 [Mycena amicta]
MYGVGVRPLTAPRPTERICLAGYSSRGTLKIGPCCASEASMRSAYALPQLSADTLIAISSTLAWILGRRALSTAGDPKRHTQHAEQSASVMCFAADQEGKCLYDSNENQWANSVRRRTSSSNASLRTHPCEPETPKSMPAIDVRDAHVAVHVWAEAACMTTEYPSGVGFVVSSSSSSVRRLHTLTDWRLAGANGGQWRSCWTSGGGGRRHDRMPMPMSPRGPKHP